VPAAEQVHDIPAVQPADTSAVIRRLQTDNALLSVQLNAVTDELQHAKEMASYNNLFHYLDISHNPDLVRHYTGLNADVFDVLVTVTTNNYMKLTLLEPLFNAEYSNITKEISTNEEKTQTITQQHYVCKSL